MASYDLVQWTIDTLAANWEREHYPGSHDGEPPVLINRDDSEVFEITSSGTAVTTEATVGTTFQERSVQYELTKNNAITVGSGPNRTTSPIGTEYDHSVEDGVGILVEGAHESEWGHVADGTEFTELYEEAMRALLVERTWPLRNPDGDTHFHTLTLENEANLSTGNKDYYRYDFDVLFDGYEELP